MTIKLNDIIREYPLPKGTHLLSKPPYIMLSKNEYWLKGRIGSKDGEPVFGPISTPVGIVARLRRIDEDESYGLRLPVQDLEGRRRIIDITRADLAGSSNSQLEAKLLDYGVRFQPGGARALLHLLRATSADSEIRVVSRCGWHQIPGQQATVFVCPNGVVCGDEKAQDIELTRTGDTNAQAQNGSLEGWKNAVGVAVNQKDCQHWQFALCVAFAGPLIDLLHLETCGINLSGESSTGKTTAQKLAASVWGSPETGSTNMRTWRTTENALEPVARGCTGSVLCLDDLAHTDGRIVGKVIYFLNSGAGKSRMTKGRGLEDQILWRTFVLSSGEMSIGDKVKEDKGRWQQGMTARFPDVDVSEVNRYVEKEIIEKFMTGVRDNFGVAGTAFCNELVKQGLHQDTDELRRRIDDAANELASDEHGLTTRVAAIFALVCAGAELASEFGILPGEIDVPTIIAWAWQRYRRSSDASILDSKKQAIENLYQWIAQHWDVDIKATMGEAPNSKEAVGWYDENIVYILKDKMREAMGGLIPSESIGKLLSDCGLIAKREEPNRAAIRYVPKVGNVMVYALDRKTVGR